MYAAKNASASRSLYFLWISPSSTTGKKKIVWSLKAKATDKKTAERIGLSVARKYRLITMKNTYTESHCAQHAPSSSAVGSAITVRNTGSAAFSPANLPAARIMASASR